MTIELGLVGSLLGLGLFFCGLLLANKVTGFGANPAALAVVSTITFLVGLIPSVGGVIAIVSQYVMLKKINPEGAVIFTMLVSIITTALVFAFAAKLI
jgi:putative effector of murein hydrolase